MKANRCTVEKLYKLPNIRFQKKKKFLKIFDFFGENCKKRAIKKIILEMVCGKPKKRLATTIVSHRMTVQTASFVIFLVECELLYILMENASRKT